METEQELKQLKEDLKNVEVKELSLKWRIILFLGMIGFILFNLWMEFYR